jgi:hypothetical protein
LFTDVIDTGNKFIIGVVVTGDPFSAVSTTPIKIYRRFQQHSRSKKIRDKD